jgi:hypothetical protein
VCDEEIGYIESSTPTVVARVCPTLDPDILVQRAMALAVEDECRWMMKMRTMVDLEGPADIRLPLTE